MSPEDIIAKLGKWSEDDGELIGLPESQTVEFKKLYSLAVAGVSEHVIGVDVHPVAVTFARVTYLLAIGLERLQSPERGPVSIPVYLGDSIQWGQIDSLFSQGALAVPTGEGATLFSKDLRLRRPSP